MRRIIVIAPMCLALTAVASTIANAQVQMQVQKQPPAALELSATDIKTFIDQLPKGTRQLMSKYSEEPWAREGLRRAHLKARDPERREIRAAVGAGGTPGDRNDEVA